jgi:hypothetical protein
MALLDDLADRLADDVMLAMAELGNDRLYMDVAKVLGTSSPSMQEAFLTSIRLRLAERRGREFLEGRSGHSARAARPLTCRPTRISLGAVIEREARGPRTRVSTAGISRFMPRSRPIRPGRACRSTASSGCF